MTDAERSTHRGALATRTVVALASAVQSAGLYPPGHPNRQEVTTDVVVRIRHLLDQIGPEEDVPTMFVVRHAFYLGSQLLASASMDHERLIAAFEEAGVGAVGFRRDVTPQDIDALLQVLRGELPVTTPIPGLAVNQVEPAVAGATLAARGIGRSSDFARQTVSTAYANAAEGRAPDVESVMRIARQLTGDVLGDTDRAVLTAVTGRQRTRPERSVDTAILAVAAGRELGRTREELATVAAGALLADIGLAQLPSEVTDHHEPLTADQRRLVHRHPVDGATLLLSTADGILATAATIALQHHARVDGDGYPQLGVGCRPTVDAQLVGIADTYGALIRPRPYRRAARPRHAIATILAERNHAWDAPVVDAFVDVLGTHPVGSYVRMASGDLALVARANPRIPDRPTVRLVRDGNGGELDGAERDTSEWDGFDFVWNIASSVGPLELSGHVQPQAADVGV